MVEGSLLQNCWARPFRWSRFLAPPIPATRDPPVHSHYPAAVTTIIIFLLAQPRTVMAGQRSWKKFPPRSAKYTLCIFTVYRGARISEISFIRSRVTGKCAIILNYFQSFGICGNEFRPGSRHSDFLRIFQYFDNLFEYIAFVLSIGSFFFFFLN